MVKPNELFLQQPKHFWANVRSISEHLGYTDRKTKNIRVYSLAEMSAALTSSGLTDRHIVDEDRSPTPMGQLLLAYFEHRADVLNSFVQPRLMDAERAKATYESLRDTLRPTLPVPMNKQKGEKAAPAYLTAIVNTIIESRIGDAGCDYDPHQLTTFILNGMPLRTFARRVDGAFPSVVSPTAIWEIKEYYYTTTFGSRVAGSVYETLLDGLEIEELRDHENIYCRHYVMVDAYYTWWVLGRSYLCRMIDILHMGYVDEVLFGYEVVEELPRIVDEWLQLEKNRTL